MLKVELIGHFDSLPRAGDSWRSAGRSTERDVVGGDARADVDFIIWHVSDWAKLGPVLDRRPAANILVVSSSGPTLDVVWRETAALPPEDRRRVHGCARAGSIAGSLELFEDLVLYFDRGDLSAGARQLLGLDLANRRLALRVALEFARHKLQMAAGVAPTDAPPERLDMHNLLGPAFRLAEPMFASLTKPIEEAIREPDSTENLRAAVEQALAQLCESPSASGAK
jgi:hypothetical protein